MAKKKKNEEIFAEIRESGVMTEQQMKLLKMRSNIAKKDVLDYNLVEEIGGGGYGIPLTADQGIKGLVWLWKVLKSRKCPFGCRERSIVESAKPEDFTLICFYDENGRGDNYIPVYGLNGMKYRMERGECVVVG